MKVKVLKVVEAICVVMAAVCMVLACVYAFSGDLLRQVMYIGNAAVFLILSGVNLGDCVDRAEAEEGGIFELEVYDEDGKEIEVTDLIAKDGKFIVTVEMDDEEPEEEAKE